MLIPAAKDLFEIILLSFLCHRWLVWLHNDKQKPLLGYFLSYCLLWFASILLQLQTIITFLYATLPIALLGFILVHRRVLQKNYIALYKIKPEKNIEPHWLQHIVGFCLQASTDISILLEHTAGIADMVHIGIPLCAPLSRDVLSFIGKSSDFNPANYILADTHGQLLGINVAWQGELNNQAFKTQDGRTYYHVTDSDACMIYYMHTKRTFTVVLKHKVYADLQATQLLQSINHYIHTAPLS